MTFEDLYKIDDFLNYNDIELDGWIAFLKGELYLIEKDYDSDYSTYRKVKILNRSIEMIIRKSAVHYGGPCENGIYHKAKVIGQVTKSPDLGVLASEIYIDGFHRGLETVDISQENKEKYKIIPISKEEEEEIQYWFGR